MTQDQQAELLPCPFCGGDAHLTEIAGEMPSFYPIVKCKSCGNRGLPATTGEQAIAAWNTRATPKSSEGELLEAARELLDVMKAASHCADALDSRAAGKLFAAIAKAGKAQS